MGGDDFDECITEHLLQVFEQQTGVKLQRDAMALQRVRQAAEQAKKELSSATSAQVNLPFIAQGSAGPLHMDIT